MFLDPAHGFIDQADQRRLETNTLDDIESGAMLTLAALVLHKIDAAPRMPQAGIPTEEKESSHRRHGTSSGVVQQMIGLSQNLWRLSIIVRLARERFNRVGIQSIPCGVQRLLPFVNHGSFGFLETLDLFRWKRRRLGGDAIKGTSAGDAIDLEAGSDLKFKRRRFPKRIFSDAGWRPGVSRFCEAWSKF